MSEVHNNTRYLSSAALVALLGAAGLLAGCDDNAAELRQNTVDLVNAKSPPAVGRSVSQVILPKELLSTSASNVIDLEDSSQVARAMGINITGNREQTLYNITIISSDSAERPNNDHRSKTIVIPVTVENIKAGAALVNLIEDLTVTGNDKGWAKRFEALNGDSLEPETSTILR